MPISAYLKGLRTAVGSRPLLTPGVDAVIYNGVGQLLLVRRSDDNLWEIPGGQLDPLEPPALGIVREVFEETGLKVIPVALLGIFGGTGTFHIQYPNGDEVDPVVALFECRVVAGELCNRDGEAAEVAFFSPAELPSTLTPITSHLLTMLEQQKSFEWDERWLETLR